MTIPATASSLRNDQLKALIRQTQKTPQHTDPTGLNAATPGGLATSGSATLPQ